MSRLHKPYWKRMLISLDQTFLNVLPSPLLNWWLEPAHPFGLEDETLSSVMGKNLEFCSVCRVVCKVVSFFFRQNTHCKDSIERDEV